jgi:hypothetical protein
MQIFECVFSLVGAAAFSVMQMATILSWINRFPKRKQFEARWLRP